MLVKKGGEFYTPHEVSQILAKIVTDNIQPQTNTFTVYDPTMGSGSLLLTVRNELPDGSRQGAVSFYGQELNTVTYNLARMNLMMHGVTYNNMTLNNADTLEAIGQMVLTVMVSIDHVPLMQLLRILLTLLNGIIMKANLKIHVLVNMVN